MWDQRNPDGVFQHINNFKDNEAQFCEFPWMAVVLKSTPLPSGIVEDSYVPVVDSVIQEGFHVANLYNDFALLYLAEPANLNDHIDTICLPTPEQLIDPTKCLVAGRHLQGNFAGKMCDFFFNLTLIKISCNTEFNLFLKSTFSIPFPSNHFQN